MNTDAVKNHLSLAEQYARDASDFLNNSLTTAQQGGTPEMIRGWQMQAELALERCRIHRGQADLASTVMEEEMRLEEAQDPDGKLRTYRHEMVIWLADKDPAKAADDVFARHKDTRPLLFWRKRMRFLRASQDPKALAYADRYTQLAEEYGRKLREVSNAKDPGGYSPGNQDGGA